MSEHDLSGLFIDWNKRNRSEGGGVKLLEANVTFWVHLLNMTHSLCSKYYKPHKSALASSASVFFFCLFWNRIFLCTLLQTECQTTKNIRRKYFTSHQTWAHNWLDDLLSLLLTGCQVDASVVSKHLPAFRLAHLYHVHQWSLGLLRPTTQSTPSEQWQQEVCIVCTVSQSLVYYEVADWS